MADPAVVNIVHTGAILWNAPVGTSIPDETSINFGTAWGGDWVRVGYTKAPLTLAYESTESDVNVEEALAPVKRFRISENLTVETTLAELTALYLQLAAANQDSVSETSAGAGQDAFEETGLGGDAVMTEKAWGFECRHIETDGTEQPIRLFIHKATAMINGNLEFSQKADDYPGIPLQVKALSDETQSAGQKLCLFQRVTGEKSS